MNINKPWKTHSSALLTLQTYLCYHCLINTPILPTPPIVYHIRLASLILFWISMACSSCYLYASVLIWHRFPSKTRPVEPASFLAAGFLKLSEPNQCVLKRTSCRDPRASSWDSSSSWELPHAPKNSHQKYKLNNGEKLSHHSPTILPWTRGARISKDFLQLSHVWVAPSGCWQVSYELAFVVH